jgi:hypothetical protein
MELSRSVLAHSEAVTAIEANIETAHKQRYEDLQAKAKSARLDCEEKRRQLVAHVSAHGCEIMPADS